MNTRIVLLFVLMVASASLIACESQPPCEPGKLGAEFESEPLAAAVPSGEDVTVCTVSDGATHAQLWRPVEVHRANVDAVGQAQDNGWARLDDNWYHSKDFSGTPKWSELESEAGKLRIDVKEAGGGAQIDLTFTPKSEP